MNEELKVLAEHLPFDVWVRDADQRCIYANPTAQRHFPGLVGLTPDETDADPAALAVWRANNARAYAGELVVGDVEYGVGARRRVVRNYITPVRRNGAVIGTVGVNVDITAQRDAEDAAAERQAVVTAVFDAAHVAFGIREIVGDDDMLHVADNRAALAVHGATTSIEGRTDASLGVSRESRVAAIRAAHEAAALGRPVEFEVTYPTPRGPRTFRGHVASIDRSSPSSAERFLFIAEDLTDVRQLEAQVQRGERLASLGTLAASVAHDIKNPATATQLSLGVLRAQLASVPGMSEADRAQLLATVADAEEGTRHVARLVTDLGLLARPADDLSEQVELDEVVRCAVALARWKIQQSAELELDLAAPRPLSGSSVRLAQVVLNLILNALHAIDLGGRHGTLVLRTREDAGVARLEVEDDGVGIDESIRDHIFEAFVTGSSGGTGLGLYSCRQIVQAHGGTIVASPREGGGTVFRVELPLGGRAAT